MPTREEDFVREIDLIHRQLDLVAVSVANRVQRLYDGLESIGYLTKMLFCQPGTTPEVVDRWVEEQRFEALPSGYFESAERIERLHRNGIDPDDGVAYWPVSLSADPELRRRFYIIRSILPYAKRLCRQIEATWLYYQDGGTNLVAFGVPAIAPENMVPAGFNWHEYHSFTIVCPENNPDRIIRWSLPTVDYGDQGLVSCVSKPIYDGDRLLGVWTIDVQLEKLHADLALQPIGNIGKRQSNFVTDFSGRLIAHPSLDVTAEAEKGAQHNVMLSSLGGDFVSLDVPALAAQGQGDIEIRDANGERLVIVFRALPGIDWIIYASFPKVDMIEAIQAAFQRAFDQAGAGDLSVRIDEVSDGVMQQLVTSYNGMITTLQESLRRREEVENEKRKLILDQQRVLERKVEERTAELAVAKEAADRANRAKSDFLSSMSHELRTPLNGILGYAQVLERSQLLASSDRTSIQVIKKSGEHLLMLINDVLDLAKIEAGKMDLSPRDFHFAAFLRTVSNIARVRADQNGVEFTQQTIGVMPQLVRGDEKRLTQILLNLLGNAIKFTENGSVELRTEFGPETGGARRVSFYVEDTGPGIAPEHLEHIFDPFAQVGDQDKKHEGTGLGLAITKSIVEQMGGTIAVDSELGKGSTFSVQVELAIASTQVDRDVFDAASIDGYTGERRKVLVVDDNTMNRELARSLLSSVGFEVVEAASGEAALEVAPSEAPAAILMDIAMSGIDGFEATRRLRAMTPFAHTPIIACSASLSQKIRQESEQAGFSDFLSKPIDLGVLLKKLGTHLGVEWTRTITGVSQPIDESEEIVPPAADQVQALLALALEGRLQDVVALVDELEIQDSSLVPWLRQARQLAQEFEVEALCTYLSAPE